jgi:hypothetical protein
MATRKTTRTKTSTRKAGKTSKASRAKKAEKAVTSRKAGTADKSPSRAPSAGRVTRTARGRAASKSRGTPVPPGIGATLPRTVSLWTNEGELATVAHDDRLHQAALALRYRTRNRIRWNGSERGRRAQAKECADLIRQFGISSEQLERIAASGVVEVRMPIIDGSDTLATYGMPWEYLLCAATRDLRQATPLRVVRHLDRTSTPSPRRSTKRVLVVVSSPGRIDDVYGFGEEEELAPQRLKAKKSTTIVRTPTLDRLRSQVRRIGPDVIHIGGVDTHQGAELLGEPDKWPDGMLLRGAEEKSHLAVSSAELVGALCANAKKPALVVFNLYHSAASTAALAVAHGAGVAVGFQDTFDDLAAELFIGDFYRAWASTRGDALVAFHAGWEALRDFPQSLSGTGIVLWSGSSLVLRKAEEVQTRVERSYEVIQQAKNEVVEFRDGAQAKKGLLVDCKPIGRLNYSLLHNRRPLFESFELRKALAVKGTVSKVSVEVELAAGEAPLVWRETQDVGDLCVDLSGKIFLPLTSQLARTLEENLDTSLTIKVSASDFMVYQTTQRVTLLPVNEWVDDDENRQFLPSFIWPLDGAVRRVIAAAQPYLSALADSPSAGFDGYQCIDPELEEPTIGVDHQAAAIWRALLDLRLGYVNPPPVYTPQSQRLRTPSKIMEGGRGTCIDLALLVAACLEYVEIYPVIFLLEGHAFPGYWRSDEAWEKFVQLDSIIDAGMNGSGGARPAPNLGGTPWMFPTSPKTSVRRAVCKLVREQIEDGSLVALESVWLTTQKGFQEAMDDGWDNLSNLSEFCCLIDLASARSAEPAVTPLPLTGLVTQ